MKKSHILLGFCLMLIGFASTVQAQITEEATFGKFAITNAKIHTVTDGVIENGIVLIEGKKISFVGTNAKITADFDRIDAKGKHVYPGFIDSGTLLGLKEIGAVAVTNDQAELGNINPHVRAFTAINPSSVNIPVTRVNGITTVISHPVSGVIAGKATFINLYGYTPDSMAVVQDAALHVDWPSKAKRGWWDDRDEKERMKDFNKRIGDLKSFWDKAQYYHEMMTKYEQNPQKYIKPNSDVRYKAMRDVFAGDLKVMISVDKAEDILESIKWSKDLDGIDVILSSVQEGYMVAEEIAESRIPCLVGPVLRTPSRDYVNYQRPYQNAGMLHDAGVMVAIRTGETENVRNLNFNAGYAAAYGLGKEEALKAVTINPAKIFGVDDQIGSITAGKIANLFISDGDPFETLTQIEHLFIEGVKVPLENRQTQLYDEFIDRADVK